MQQLHQPDLTVKDRLRLALVSLVEKILLVCDPCAYYLICLGFCGIGVQT
jgi:hypothetical protein